jgi:hypothetical protein
MFLPRRARVAAVAAVLSLFTVGCGGTNDTRPDRWGFISATITEPACATVNCHSAVTQSSGVDLHDAAAGYKSLVGGLFVIPYHDDQSSLTNIWLTNSAPLTMPPDNPLPAVDVQLIADWINAGAMDN